MRWCVGVGIAQGGLPIAADVALLLRFEAPNSVFAGHDEEPGIVRVRQRHIGAIEIIYGRAEEQAREYVPFDADLLILEFLRRERYRAAGQRAELIARGREVRDAVHAID